VTGVKTNLRSPIIVTVGHIDHGKTTLLDRIRGTYVAKGEAGLITQHVGASYIPIDTVKNICGDLLEKFKTGLEIPGLLLVDTPGHSAFTTLRKRGGAVSDLAILVVDIVEGFKEQTDESLKILKEFKTPFIVAATKIDRIQGWYPHENSCFIDSFQKQGNDVKDEIERRIYQIVSQLSDRGFDSERFDRIEDFTKHIAIVPCSGQTGEGIPELLMLLAGLSQQFLKDRIELSDISKGTILEIKETKGFGTTIDVILYDGKIKKGDYLVIGGKQPVVTKIKALLVPREMQELRVEKNFESVEEVQAASGIKIAAPELENAAAGSPLIAVSNENEIENAKEMVQSEVEEIQFDKDVDGVVVKADTLGSLEAMIKLLGEENIPIRRAEVGNVNKDDVISSQNAKDELKRIVLAFNVKIPDDINTLSKDLGIKIFDNNIIYRLIEDYKEWCLQKKERDIEKKLEEVMRPVELRVLPGFVFRQSDPAVFGVEVLRGYLKPGVLMKRKDGKKLGRIKEIQREGQTAAMAKKGDKIAVSMVDVTIGRNLNEKDVIVSVLSEHDLKILREIIDRLSDDERILISELTG
jgi:translation initiation factor 5B